MTAANKYIIKKYHFSQEEDEALKSLVQKYGENDWALIASEMPNRSTRQCRERWLNHLKDTVNKGKWTLEEDNLLKIKYQQIDPKWKYMEQFFPGRTSISIRNRFNCLHRYNNLYAYKNIISNPYQVPFYQVNQFQTYPTQPITMHSPSPTSISNKTQENIIQTTNPIEENTILSSESYADLIEDNIFDFDFYGLNFMNDM